MPKIYLDIETEGLDPFTCSLVTLQLLTESGKKIIIKDPENLDGIKTILESNLIVGHNIKFDSKFLKHQYGITLYNVYDTYIAEIAISGGLIAGRKGASLKDLVFKYCGVTIDKSQHSTFKKGDKLTEKQVEYAINDLLFLPEIMKQQQAKIKILGIQETIDIEMKAIPAMVWLELSGISVNTAKIAEIRKQVIENKKKAEDFLNKELQEKTTQKTLFNVDVKTEINLDSPTEVLKVLQKKGYKLNGTSEKELSGHRNDPIIKSIIEYRQASKMLSSFVDSLPQKINSVTGRIHPNFNQYGTRSGRLSCTNPNIQQQPKTYDWRDIFCAEKGNKLVTSDYSQVELRILAQVSGDKEYLRAYNDGEDLHKLTASKVFGVEIESVTKEQRSIAKTVNFGIAYGMWTGGLIGNLKKAGIALEEKDAEKIIREFHRSYSGVSNYLSCVSAKGLRDLKLYNRAGRLIKFNEPEGEKQKGNIKRESKNLPIQSLCADMLKIALSELFLKLEPKGVMFVNTVHDEIVLECREEDSEEVARVLKEEMEKAGRMFLTDLPCISEAVISDVWGK